MNFNHPAGILHFKRVFPHQSMSERDQFLAKVKQIIKPALLANGFQVSGTTYRRKLGKVIHVVNLQGSRHGGQCCVCLGIHLDFLQTAGSGNICDPAKITEPECEFRLRLAPEGQTDCWWNYGVTEDEAEASVESILQLYREVGLPYFERFATFPDDFVLTKPSMLVSGAPLPFPGYSTIARQALTLGRIALYTNRIADAKQFAEIGLRHVGPATGLINEFHKILATE